MYSKSSDNNLHDISFQYAQEVWISCIVTIQNYDDINLHPNVHLFVHWIIWNERY